MKKIISIPLAVLLVYSLLLIPDTENVPVVKAGSHPFLWNRDIFWNKLEADFNLAKTKDKRSVDSAISLLFTELNHDLDRFQQQGGISNDTLTDKLLSDFFNLSTLVAVQPYRADSLIHFYSRCRNVVKRQSSYTGISDVHIRNSVYKILYGMRAAVEEVLLQPNKYETNPAVFVTDESSATPSATIMGIKVHSGDLLVSRGGAEVSALISRGNDHPGNFSHVALLYVDEKTNRPYLIEAHIERGVAVSSAEQYIKDRKLRFMVMRPRADLPEIKKDPMLPHMAAKEMLDGASRRHIPYDFAMDFNDTTAMFCSEVGSYAYKNHGIILWKDLSTISSSGIVNWLHSFGVLHFITQMPADLEYDSQLSIVAEWRDNETLFKDHVDNAVMDVLLEKADSGLVIPYDHWKLPLVRVFKLYGMLQNLFGNESKIPEGMSATQALRNQSFVSMFNTLKQRTLTKVTRFKAEKKYNPPYWKLIALAKEAGSQP